MDTKKDTNRFIGAQPPSMYLARLVEQQGIPKLRLDEIVRSHLIEPQTLWNEDFEAFLKSRSEHLSLSIDRVMGNNLSEVKSTNS